jgi:hypothetical protein
MPDYVVTVRVVQKRKFTDDVGVSQFLEVPEAPT